jgi:hypothetical protein
MVMAERFVVFDTETLGIPVFDNEDDANKLAADSATPKVVVAVAIPDDSQHVLYDEIHTWANETDDPSTKGKTKYVDRYDNAGKSFDDHRSIPREVVDAYYNQRGQDAENKPATTRKPGVKVNRDG